MDWMRPEGHPELTASPAGANLRRFIPSGRARHSYGYACASLGRAPCIFIPIRTLVPISDTLPDAKTDAQGNPVRVRPTVTIKDVATLTNDTWVVVEPASVNVSNVCGAPVPVLSLRSSRGCVDEKNTFPQLSFGGSRTPAPTQQRRFFPTPFQLHRSRVFLFSSFRFCFDNQRGFAAFSGFPEGGEDLFRFGKGDVDKGKFVIDPDIPNSS